MCSIIITLMVNHTRIRITDSAITNALGAFTFGTKPKKNPSNPFGSTIGSTMNDMRKKPSMQTNFEMTDEQKTLYGRYIGVDLQNMSSDAFKSARENLNTLRKSITDERKTIYGKEPKSKDEFVEFNRKIREEVMVPLRIMTLKEFETLWKKLNPRTPTKRTRGVTKPRSKQSKPTRMQGIQTQTQRARNISRDIELMSC